MTIQQSISSPIVLKPLINYPRYAQVGETYLLTIDFKHDAIDEDWPYPEGPYRIVARTDDLSDETQLTKIVQSHQFWAKSRGDREPQKAVGLFFDPDLHRLVLIQGKWIRLRGLGRAFYQYLFILIPPEDLEKIGYRTYILLEWLWSLEVQKLNLIDYNLKGISIPLLSQSVLMG